MLKRVLAILLFLTFVFSSLSLTSCSENQLPNYDSDIAFTQPGKALLTVNTSSSQNDNIKILNSGDVKVMSINVYLNESSKHAPGMIKLISAADPDSIGVQEFMADWNISFESHLPQYDFVGYNMNGAQDRYCEANFIFYKKDKFKCLAWDTIWLTPTPYLPSGNPEVDNKKRACTWAVFEEIETGFRYAHVNCHLESASDEVNARQMPIVRDLVLRFAALGLPVFSTGDFNTREGGDTYSIMVTDTGIADTKFLAADTMNMGTNHGLGDYRESTGAPIDFCFTAEEFVNVKKYEVIETWVDGMYVSDHNAVMATATVKELPDQYALVPNLPTDGITVQIENVRPYVAEFSFTQANDVFHTVSYRVWAEDKDGNEICSRAIPSFNIDENRTATLNCTLSGLLPETEYTVYIAPMTIIDTYGNSVSFELITPAE